MEGSSASLRSPIRTAMRSWRFPATERGREKSCPHEVRDQKHHGPTGYDPGEVLQGTADVGASTLRAVIEELPEDPEDVSSTLPGRNELLDPVAEEDQSDLVVVLDGAECQDGAELHGHLALEPLPGPEVPGGAHVHHQNHRELPLFLEDLHEGRSRFGR